MPLARRTVLTRLLAGSSLLSARGHSLATSTVGAATLASASALVLAMPVVLQANAFADLSASVRNADGSLTAVKPQWSSSDPKLATVSRSGVIASGVVAVDSAVVAGAARTRGAAGVAGHRLCGVGHRAAGAGAPG